MTKMSNKNIMDTRDGLSLLEVMVALLLLTIASTMIYSMLNRSIFFTNRGEGKTQEIAEQYALVSLIQRQVQGGWFDPRTKKVVISGERDLLRLATTMPFQARSGQVVMAFYRYNPEEGTLYYLERKDFHNPDYTDMVPNYDEMTALVTASAGLSLEFDQENNSVALSYGGQNYEFRPWCSAVVTEVAGG